MSKNIDKIVNRFLGWKLPKDFAPDGGISFKPNEHPDFWPVGTHLFTADQAKAMFEYCLQGAEQAEQEPVAEAIAAEARLHRAVRAVASQAGESAEDTIEWLCNGGMAQLFECHFSGKNRESLCEDEGCPHRGVPHICIEKQAEQEPVAWHHPQCEGQCIACLIEKAVQDAYGTQGRDYMLRHINAAPVRTKDQK